LLCVRFETEVEKLADLIRFCHRIAAKDIVFQNTGKRPCYTGISSVTPPALPEVGGHVVELPPADCHFVAIRRVDGDHAFVGGVAEDVLAVLIDIHLVAGEHAELRDHSRRSRHDLKRRRRIVVFFEVLRERHCAHRRKLG